MEKFIYMDYAGTAFLKEEVLKEMNPYFTDFFANPSAVYSFANKSKFALDESREKIAKAINCKREEIYFTAGGSEADNWAVKGIALGNKDKGNHIITTVIEHPAILNSCKYLEREGFEVTYLPVDSFGFVDIEKFKNAIKKETILATIMIANNEIGTVQPIEEISKICAEKNIMLHCDGVQAVGSIPVDVEKLNISALSMAAHKFYGPKGIGALYVKKGVKIHNILHGGAQERGRRAGTENVAAVVGMGKAIELAVASLQHEKERLSKIRDRFIKELLSIEDSRLNGATLENRLPNNINVSFKGVESDMLLMNLDSFGICASSGSACSAGALEPSHVIKALNVPKEYLKGTVRFTIGAKTTEEEVEYVIEKVKEIVERLRKINLNWN